MQLWECKKTFYRTSYQSRISQYVGADFEEPSWSTRNSLWVASGCIAGAWQLFTAESSIPNVLLALEKWSKLANLVVPVDLCAFNFANFCPLFSVCGSGGGGGGAFLSCTWLCDTRAYVSWKAAAAVHCRKEMPNVDKEADLVSKGFVVVGCYWCDRSGIYATDRMGWFSLFSAFVISITPSLRKGPGWYLIMNPDVKWKTWSVLVYSLIARTLYLRNSNSTVLYFKNHAGCTSLSYVGSRFLTHGKRMLRSAKRRPLGWFSTGFFYGTMAQKEKVYPRWTLWTQSTK